MKNMFNIYIYESKPPFIYEPRAIFHISNGERTPNYLSYCMQWLIMYPLQFSKQKNDILSHCWHNWCVILSATTKVTTFEWKKNKHIPLVLWYIMWYSKQQSFIKLLCTSKYRLACATYNVMTKLLWCIRNMWYADSWETLWFKKRLNGYE